MRLNLQTKHCQSVEIFRFKIFKLKKSEFRQANNKKMTIDLVLNQNYFHAETEI